MPEAISDDLRRRLLGAWAAGEGSLRELGQRFGVSHAFAKKIRQQQRCSGQVERVPQSRRGFASRVDEDALKVLREWVHEQPDRTEGELRDLLWRRRRIGVCASRIGQLLRALGLRRKKTLHASERDAAENQKRRIAFMAILRALRPEQLIFLDESGVTTSMTRLYGRAEGGARIREATPVGRWEVLTLLGALSLRGVEATMTIPAPTDGDVFTAFLSQVLAPKLRPGQVVVLDNLSAHKLPRVAALVRQHGAQLLYLPPYSPDLNPIEKAWSKLKTLLRTCKARSQPALEQAVADLLPRITADDAAAWFHSCGIGLQQV